MLPIRGRLKCDGSCGILRPPTIYAAAELRALLVVCKLLVTVAWNLLVN